MKKNIMKPILAAMCTAALAFAASTCVSAAENVKVQIAPYNTEIDYMSVYNPVVEYPLISYKDITYFPMTYSLCTRLGLAIGYDNDMGLFITRHDTLYTDSTKGLFGDAGNNEYGKKYTAVIPEYPVYLNGKKIDNTKEEYPLLNFRDITYFPMTYHFAVDELGFVTEWSEETGFKLYRNETQKTAYFGREENNKLGITVMSTGQDSETDENGITTYTPYYWYDRYELQTKYDHIEYKETSLHGKDKDYPEPVNAAVSDRMFLENGYLRYISKKLLDLADRNAVSQHSREFVFDGVTFIHTTVNFGSAPAPYTTHDEYVFVLENGKIKMLEDWDTCNNLANIFPDGSGGYFLCSDHYSPAHTSRFGNDFAAVYHYKNGEFKEITIKDINSVQGIGVHDGKLYVKAMYYSSDKKAMINGNVAISAINSGFYQYDIASGKVKKLYAYIPGDVRLTANGSLYCLAQYGIMPRVVELRHGAVMELAD